VTVLVTGATGLLGGHLIDLLVERGEQVRALVRPREDATRLVEMGVEVCRGDMGDRPSLERAVGGVEQVLHCAARTGPWGPAADYERANVKGLQALVEAALDARVQRMVHVSSITVHGNDVGGTADESAPLRTEPNPYSRTKVAGERLLDAFIREREAPVTIVRPGWIYGPRDIASFGRFAQRIAAGKMVIIGSGSNHVPLIYVRDAAQGILLASEAAVAAGRTDLLVNDEPVTQYNYLSAIASELGVPPPTWHIPYRPALLLGMTAELVGHLTRLKQPPPLTRYGLQLLGGENRFMIARARADLRFVPQVSLREGVRQSVAWYRTWKIGRETA